MAVRAYRVVGRRRCCHQCRRMLVCRTAAEKEDARAVVRQERVADKEEVEEQDGVAEELRAPRQQPLPRQRRRAESTDAISSFLTRRFGLAGGIAWTAVLAFGVVSEQVKTRLEVASEGTNTRQAAGDELNWVDISPGLRYRDVRVGGGATPRRGDIVALHFVGSESGATEAFYDTKKNTGKPIVFLYGSRPFAGGMCEGVEQALATMRAGGRRLVEVPSELGFGDRGLELRGTRHVADKDARVAPGADLAFDIELVKVSIAPS